MEKNTHHCLPEELDVGDCWVALSLAQLSGLILCGRVGKHSDRLAIELVASTEGKTDCKEWGTDGWSGYERVLPTEVDHYISKLLTQRLERTNGIIRYSNRTLAPTTTQIWQDLGADEDHLAFGHQLL
ncbi:MAG: hypothetical protein N4J56_006890 [Chroococcidiopsis sp. SAG 2025]|nr:hypothetical protein [Chroococcidiopsis sp. SAG 2025]